MILSPEGVLYLICGKECSPFPLALYSTRSPKMSIIPSSLLTIFFSIVPKSNPLSTCSFLALSATFNINLIIPTVVLPAAVVPSRNSTGALCFRKSLYFSKSNTSIIWHHSSFNCRKIESSLHTLVSRVPLSSSLSSGLKQQRSNRSRAASRRTRSLLLPNNSIRVYIAWSAADCILSRAVFVISSIYCCLNCSNASRNVASL